MSSQVEDVVDRKSSTSSDGFERISQSEEDLKSENPVEDERDETVRKDEEHPEPDVSSEKSSEEDDNKIEEDEEAKLAKAMKEAGATPLVEPEPIPELPNHLEEPMKEEQKQFYNAEVTRSAISNLILFSIAMFVVPLLTMFTTYYWVFLDYFHMSEADASLYAGLCGVAMVIIIAGSFVWLAYKEESEAEHRLKEEKKTD